ncbi:GNAT family N-acetyltransferase [Actinoplanes hulinensis]|uniref:GNAT family N-acetyltransferase n=1 Tax=Actinoplanes hulinensis TaxID=1144547 RepID=A0ABS7B6Y4_9ACTN|nr:GNAT family N-acetyltransferase [Actinoplanes hulinensis]MBW6436715.1 GNAT family N-acetyltransferase [Actinoplanes hulinensis]
MMVVIKRATADDVETVLSLHAEASAWLAAKGTDQWQPDAVGRKTRDKVKNSIAKNVASGTCWLACEGSTVVGTISVDSFADPEFWKDEDNPGDAVYVHRMIVRRDHAGRGIGKVLLRLAEEVARNSGRHWVRLDAWSTNEGLHGYYRSIGFQNVRTLRFNHRGSGALFQKPVEERVEPPEFMWRTGEPVSRSL